MTLDPAQLLVHLAGRSSPAALPCVLNIDLDYFFGPGPGDLAERVLDDVYFDRLAAAVAALDRDGAFPVITIALTATDDLTAGWRPVEALATRLCAALGHEFSLP